MFQKADDPVRLAIDLVNTWDVLDDDPELLSAPSVLKGFLERRGYGAVRVTNRDSSDTGALPIAHVDLVSLGVLEAPGNYGCALAIGEGQSAGNAMGFGGPHSASSHARALPAPDAGRLVGATVDVDGQRGFVLTLQTREQHIRREKATSNICTNVALCALMATIYVSILGTRGSARSASSRAKAHYAARGSRRSGVALRFTAPVFKEFTLQLPGAGARDQAPLKDRLLAGCRSAATRRAYKDCLLVAVTEKRTKDEIDAYAAALAAAVA